MSTENTYWSENGKHQITADILSDMMPAVGDVTTGSLLQLFILTGRAYRDLYNNGLMNQESVLPPLVDALGDFRRKGYVDQAPDAVQSEIEEIVDFYQEYQDAEAEAQYSDEVDEDGDRLEPDYPSSAPLYEALEVLLDHICEMYQNGPDVFEPLPAARKAA